MFCKHNGLVKGGINNYEVAIINLGKLINNVKKGTSCSKKCRAYNPLVSLIFA